jgi:hypothetical protein
MASAKDIFVKIIKASVANQKCKELHYSGKVVQNSQIHFGVFLNGKLEGVMQYGHSLDKRKMLNTVKKTKWNEFIELNRMAFSDALPKNSESRAIGITLRLIKKHYNQIKWVVSFSDGAQCGDGTIYRASGFKLIGIKENKTLYEFPTGDRLAGMTIEHNWELPIIKKQCEYVGIEHKPRTRTQWKKYGAKPIKGYQLKYIYFTDKTYEENLTVPILPFTDIDKFGAGMYKGIPATLQSRRVTKANSDDQLESGGAIPTNTLQSFEVQ